MAGFMEQPKFGTNHLLRHLPTDEVSVLSPLLKPIEVVSGQILYDPDERIPHVHFPTTCIVAIAVPVKGKILAGAGLVGSEGIVCIRAFLGRVDIPFIALVQNQGIVQRISIEDFRLTLSKCPVLRDMLNRYTDAFLTQVSYAAVCNGVHSIEQRCCRWLLMTLDRAEASGFSLTHGFLAQMLGVQRTSITSVAKALQEKGLIVYKRGFVQVVDRLGLENLACPCYAVIRDQFKVSNDL